jgi:hypothetical protein
MDFMHRFSTTLRLNMVWPVLFMATAITGCCNPFGHEQKSCNDIVPGAIPQPNGTYACQWVRAETARADQDKFVIYQYEWSADVTRLTPSGQQHLAQIAQGLHQVPFPVVIEPSSDNRVDGLRRAAVLEALASNDSQVTPDRVVVGRSEAEGLYGSEAGSIARRMLGTQSGQGTNATGVSQMGTQTSLGNSTGVNINVGSGSH